MSAVLLRDLHVWICLDVRGYSLFRGGMLLFGFFGGLEMELVLCR